MQGSVLIFFAVWCHASSVQPDSHLANTDLAVTEPWVANLQASISNLALPDVLASVDPVTAAAQSASKDAGVKKKMPVNHQIDKAEMDRFIASVSKECGGRFQQMLLGKGGDLHTFGSQSVDANANSCKKLDGTMCATDAKIIKDKKFKTRGRTMESIMSVSGNGCLPSQCMTSSDLMKLGTFMQTQAKAIIPGDEHRVELHLDCTKNGGPTVVVGAKSGAGRVVAALFVLLAVGILDM